MQSLKAVAGGSSLKSMVASASSARMLNLHALAAERPTDPADQDKPLFVHPVLNRSIIVKHNLRPGEDARRASRWLSVTKIIFPFDPSDLSLGGQYLFVDQQDFAVALTRHLEYDGLVLERDLSVLRILDGLPTLDPFLVREALVTHKFSVDAAYYRFSEPDMAHMLGFVEREIETLIELCFGTVKTDDTRAKRLSRILLVDQDSRELEPLRQTLRLEGPQFSEAMFAWKAFLYYRWRTHDLAPELKKTMRSLSLIDRRSFDTDALRFVVSAKDLLGSTIARSWREISQKLRLYDQAYEGLTQRENPESFRTFLVNSSTLFVELGERIGRLEQVVTFWDYRLSQHHAGAMSPEDVMEAMRELLQGLSIWPSATPRPAEPAPIQPTSEAKPRVGDEEVVRL